MKFIKPLMIAFAIILLPLVVMSTMQLFGWNWPTEFVGANVVMAILLAIFVVLLIISAFGQKFRIQKIGNYILHFGFVLFLLCSLLYLTMGNSITVAVPIDGEKAYDQLKDSNGNVVDLGFAFGLDGFAITYYDPVYDVYSVTEDSPKAIMTDVQVQRSQDGVWYYDFGKYGKVTLDELLDGDKIDSIKKQFTLTNDVVASVRLIVREYVADITFIEDNGAEHTQQLLVNKTIHKNGYKIYLMGYDEITSRVTLMFKKNVGEPISTAGLVVVMAGTFYQCIVYPLIVKGQKQKALSLSAKGESK